MSWIAEDMLQISLTSEVNKVPNVTQITLYLELNTDWIFFTLWKHRCGRSLRYNISELPDGTRVKGYCDSYQADVNNQLTENSDVEQQWSTIKQCIYWAAEEITDTIQPNDRNQWFHQECSHAIEMINTLQINML